MRVALLLTTAGVALISGPAHADPQAVTVGDITISQPVVRASLGHAPTTAAYMTLSNHGAAPERLMSAACACAAATEAHMSEQMDGMMKMDASGPVVIPPHGAVTLRPGARHLMLTGLKTKLVDGGQQAITLVFDHAGAVKVRFAVKAVIATDGATVGR